MSLISRGFQRKRSVDAPADRVPPGQYVTADFPVLSAGPTPRIHEDQWRFTVTAKDGTQRSWTWSEFANLPRERFTVDIHCVTKWSKLDTVWEGVPVSAVLDGLDADSGFAVVHSYGGYTTNLPLADLGPGKAWVAFAYDDQPLAPEHGGPARLLVPHLYFWKSAKWVSGLVLGDHDRPGFWESLGYHNYGDPWREQRYSGD